MNIQNTSKGWLNEPYEYFPKYGIRVYVSDEAFQPWYVQAKRHHKRRINKKWLKRYGYKKVMPDTECYYIEALRMVVCTNDYYKKLKEALSV